MYGRVVERIVAVVNKQIILLSELRERLAPFAAQLAGVRDAGMRQQRLAELRKQVLNQMIDETLIEQEARKLKLGVADDEIDKALDQVMHRNNLTREQLESALRHEGKSIPAYREQILRPQLLRLKVLNVQVRARVSVQEDEIKALYQQNLRSLGVETRVHARHIFISLVNAGEVQREQQEALVRELMRNLRQGADFAALAREYSEDSVTRESGGDLGFFGRGTLPSNVEDEVFGMKAGEVRGPIRSERGLHIIQLVERQDSSARPYEEVREDIRNQLYNQKMEKATQAWLSDVRKRSYVDVRLP